MYLHPGFNASSILPLWLSDQCPTNIPCIHSPPFSCCIAKVDLESRKEIFLQVSTPLLVSGCLFFNADWLLSLLKHSMGGLLSLDSMPLHGLLNRGVTRLCNLGLMGVNLICYSKALKVIYERYGMVNVWWSKGDRSGMPADVQVCWHDSTAHVQRFFPPKV